MKQPAIGFALLLLGTAALAEEIPRNEYLTYVPLNYPRLVQQSPATERLSRFC